MAIEDIFRCDPSELISGQEPLSYTLAGLALHRTRQAIERSAFAFRHDDPIFIGDSAHASVMPQGVVNGPTTANVTIESLCALMKMLAKEREEQEKRDAAIRALPKPLTKESLLKHIEQTCPWNHFGKWLKLKKAINPKKRPNVLIRRLARSRRKGKPIGRCRADVKWLLRSRQDFYCLPPDWSKIMPAPTIAPPEFKPMQFYALSGYDSRIVQPRSIIRRLTMA